MPVATSAKRGRPPSETPHEKLLRLEREIETVRAEVKEANQRTFSMLGEAIAAEAGSDGEFKARLDAIVSKHIKSPSARAEIAQLWAA